MALARWPHRTPLFGEGTIISPPWQRWFSDLVTSVNGNGGGGGGTPDAHAPSHEDGGSDPVSILTLAGYPGGTTTFLRGDGTFAVPPGGSVGGFTEGSVIFAAPDGTLTEDNAQLFWDNTNNRLGVGLPTPSAQVQVWGVGQLTGALSVAGTQTGTLNISSSDDSAYTGGALLFSSKTPGGTTNADPQWALKSLLFDGSTHGIGDLCIAGRELTADVALTPRMYFKPSGLIGIGTDSPRARLSILHGPNAMGLQLAAYYTETAGASSGVAKANMYLQLGGSEYNTGSNRLIGFGFAGASNINVPAYLGFRETTDAGHTYGELIFATRNVTTDTAPTVRMRVTAAGPLRIDVNAGLGLGNPQLILLNGASDESCYLGTNGADMIHSVRADYNAYLFYFGASGRRMQLNGNGSGSHMAIYVNGDPLDIQGAGTFDGYSGIDLTLNANNPDGGSLGVVLNRTALVSAGAVATFQYNGTAVARLSTAGALRLHTYGAGTLVSDASGNITSGTPTSGGIPAAHASTHQPGGSDLITTLGPLTLDQGALDASILSFVSSDVTHGFIVVDGSLAQTTQTFGLAVKTSPTLGGLRIVSTGEDAALRPAMKLQSYGGQAHSTQSSTGQGLMEFYVAEVTGAGAKRGLVTGTNAYSWSVFNHSTTDTTLMILDEEADLWLGRNLEVVGSVILGSTSLSKSGTTLQLNATIVTAPTLQVTPRLFINDTANVNNAKGITINQMVSHDHVLTFKGDVLTALTSAPFFAVEADDFASFANLSSPSGGGTGGLHVQALGSNNLVNTNCVLASYGGQADATKSTAGRSLIELTATQHNGANVLANLTALGNIVGIRGREGGAEVTEWICGVGGATWQAGGITAAGATFTTPLSVASGGTGLASYAVGDLIYASAATTLSKLADVAAGSYLRSGGVTTAPVWSTATLPNAATIGDLIYASASNVYSNLADVAVGRYLRSGGVTTAPLWSTLVLPNAATANRLVYATATNTYGESANLTFDGTTLAVTGGVTLTTPLSVASGGTGLASYAIGDLIYASAATTLAKLADVAAGSYLRSGGVTTAPVWSTLILPNAATVNQVVYATSANTYGGSANLTYDGTTLALGGASGAIVTQFGTVDGTRTSIVDGSGRFTIRYDNNAMNSVVTINNRSITAAGHGSAINFGLAAGGAASVEAAKISVESEAATFTGATADATFRIAVALNGTTTERFRITSDGTIVFAATSVASAASIVPTPSDGAALGTTGNMWSDLFLASGGVINWNAGNYTIAHTAGRLDFQTASAPAALYLTGVGANTELMTTHSTAPTTGGVQALNGTIRVGSTTNHPVQFGVNNSTYYMQVSTAGVFTFTGSTGIHSLDTTVAGSQTFRVQNTDSGTASYAAIQVNANSANTFFGVFSSTYTTAGPDIANGSRLSTNGNGGLSIVAQGISGDLRFYNRSSTLALTIGAAQMATFTGGITHGSATLLTTTVALTNGAAALAATIANSPKAGNPTKWIPINDNGTTRYIPAW